MLPSDIIYQICRHLSLSDVVSFSAALNYAVPDSAIRDSLLNYCPYYDEEYSGADSWIERAVRYLSLLEGKSFGELDCPEITDKPLPTDFECLCKDAEESCYFNYNDSGVFLGDFFVDLSGTRSEIMTSSLNRVKNIWKRTSVGLNTLLYYNGQSLVVQDEQVEMFRCSPQIMTVVARDYQNVARLIIKSRSHKTCRLSSTNGLCTPQVFGNTVIAVVTASEGVSFVVFCGPSSTASPGSTRSPTPVSTTRLSPPPVPATRLFTSSTPSQTTTGLIGHLFYDGHVILLSISPKGERKYISHSAESPKSTQGWLLSFSRAQQDTRHVRYGLVFTLQGLVTDVVDLKTRAQRRFDISESSNVSSNDSSNQLRIVGVSGGSLGVWKYSKKYLRERFKEQYPNRELPKEVEQLLASSG